MCYAFYGTWILLRCPTPNADRLKAKVMANIFVSSFVENTFTQCQMWSYICEWNACKLVYIAQTKNKAIKFPTPPSAAHLLLISGEIAFWLAFWSVAKMHLLHWCADLFVGVFFTAHWMDCRIERNPMSKALNLKCFSADYLSILFRGYLLECI